MGFDTLTKALQVCAQVLEYADAIWCFEPSIPCFVYNYKNFLSCRNYLKLKQSNTQFVQHKITHVRFLLINKSTEDE